MALILIDTNILVYAVDRGEYTKQQQAIHILEQLRTAGTGILSVQSFAEFFRAVTRGSSSILPVDRARQQMESIAQVWTILPLTPAITLEAARGVQQAKMAFWDAQIWAAARLNQIEVVFSEDFNVGATLEGVRFVNPFAPNFQIDDWI